MPGGVLAFPIFGPHLVASLSHGKPWPGDSVPRVVGTPPGAGVSPLVWGCELLSYFPWGQECGGAKGGWGSPWESLAEQDGSWKSPQTSVSWGYCWGWRHEGLLGRGDVLRLIQNPLQSLVPRSCHPGPALLPLKLLPP